MESAPRVRMADILERADALGPGKVVHVCEPSVGLRAVLVVDNVALAW
jgi:glutamate dehydrogenase (NAD(P)+)